MNVQASRDDSLRPPLPLACISNALEWIPDLTPRTDGIRFARGILLGIALCLPVWAFVCWAVASRY
jgi:hypothetical protein